MRYDVCSMCRFWQENPTTSGETGECRRRPPTVHVIQVNPALVAPAGGPKLVPMAAFPMTQATSWCGEFEEAEDETPHEGPRAA